MIQSHLLNGAGEKEKLERIEALFKQKAGLNLNLSKPNPDVLHITADNSIGISQIRQLISFLSRKPFSLNLKIVLIHNAEKLTIPAQNSLLKTLEEPPKNSFIFLLTDHFNGLLPTILSRVQITKLKPNNKPSLTIKQEKKAKEIWQKTLRLAPEERIALSLSLVKSKTETETLITCLLEYLRKAVQKQNLSLSLKQAKKAFSALETARKMLKANVNFHLVIENLFLNLPKNKQKPFSSS